MSSNSIFLLLFSFFIIINSSISISIQPSTPISPSLACNTTLDPTFCKTHLPSNPKTLFDFTRFSLSISLSNANTFLQTINSYILSNPLLPSPSIKALQDCKLLSDLNIDFLLSSSNTCNSSTNLLDSQSQQVQTLLSALLANHQTCLDSLQETSTKLTIINGISSSLSYGTKLYSLSLALFSHTWPQKNKNKTLFNGRKLLQSVSDGTVKVNSTVVVNKDGSGDFVSINDAISAAPNNTQSSDGYYLIKVSAGLYEEYVSIAKNKKYIMMVGEGINQTIITGNHSVVDGWTTFNSATFIVVGEGFVGVNLTIKNTAGAVKHQAVALRSGADLSAFYRCSFEGYQDTLYSHSLRQFYKECDIYGTVDYIFGNSAVVFQDCNIYSRLPMQSQKNTVTAQGRTDPNQNTGTSIQNSNFLATPDLDTALNNGSVIRSFLGRPWKEYSRTVVMESFIGSLIDPQGWLPWDGDFALNTSYYAEYDNRGPGSNTSGRVTWEGFHVINSTDAVNFTVSNFILGDNWLGSTGVPYKAGL
ncbi:pectinesterase-like [Dioscorea cayenensis subsp. rotundata]|uniref:Pectinesterase n=1 Tax=Dioscorea cayennensis subsp. rotundata TaxID=55577 RepID=A0AB40BJ10_DIOCR|nr:pectinesterase-like [Dioscorea cayenensis subsp. rotundata]